MLKSLTSKMTSSAKMLLCASQMRLIACCILLTILKYMVADGHTLVRYPQDGPPIEETRTDSTESSDITEAPKRNCECGISSVNRIIGGVETAPHRFPWMAFLQITKNGETFQCGGFLITDKHVLTAAHCTDGATASSVTASLGVHNIAHPEYASVKVNSSKIHNHPSYNMYDNSEDIAVITLKTPVKFSPTIRPLCLPTDRKNYTLTNATIAGWGTLTDSGNSSEVLMEATVPIWNDKVCKSSFAKRGITITDKMICAGGDKVDTCQGDSGGPLMHEDNGKFTAIGIVSFGIGCARPNVPGVYSRIDNLIEFVDSVIGSTEKCA